MCKESRGEIAGSCIQALEIWGLFFHSPTPGGQRIGDSRAIKIGIHQIEPGDNAEAQWLTVPSVLLAS